VRSITICAEIGHNHNGDFAIAKELIHKAKELGADIAKFQLYDTDKLFKPDFEWYWDLKRGELDFEQWTEVARECRKAGIECLASVFDTERVDWCQKVGVMRYKIASRSIYDTELLDKVISTGKDIIISLGMVDARGVPKITAPVKVDYLYCIAKYPTPLSDLHFNEVDFRKYGGFSDHTVGIEAPVMAMARGARIIEKHFTLDKKMDGCDHSGSMEPDELRELVRFARKFEEMR